MGESELTAELDSEPAFAARAAQFARALHAARAWPLVLGLRGDLGSGKTTWVRAMLRGLGHVGRVPSPTYTLLEHYVVGDLAVVHLDLYRLRGDAELENLGVRDWLARDRALAARRVARARAAARAAMRSCTLEFAVTSADGRRVTGTARTRLGIEALSSLRQEAFNNDP